jgi:K+-transporting ATPase KdpF subunit
VTAEDIVGFVLATVLVGYLLAALVFPEKI